MTVIDIHGAAYGDNFGDVLIHSILSNELSQRGFATRWPLSAPKFRDHQRSLGWTPRTKLFTRSRGIIFGPGGYLSVGHGAGSFAGHSRWNRRFYSYHLPALLASHGIERTAFFGLEIGPVPGRISNAAIRTVVEAAQLVAVRTQESASWLVDTWGVTSSVIPDVALNLEPPGAYPCEKDGGALLHVGNPRLWRADTRLRETFQRLSQDYPTKIITDTSRLTRSTREAIVDTNLRSHLSPYSGVSDLLRTISNSQIVVTTKLHVSICAYALGVPVIQIYQHLKTQRFNAATASQGQALRSLKEFAPSDLPELIEAASRSSLSLLWAENRRQERKRLSEAFDALASSVGSRDPEC